MPKNLQQMQCTRHNLDFAFDADRVRELGEEPALMRCPLCMHKSFEHQRAQADELRGHRDLLLKAIDLKTLLQPAG